MILFKGKNRMFFRSQFGIFSYYHEFKVLTIK